jgi:hypothetical protein
VIASISLFARLVMAAILVVAGGAKILNPAGAAREAALLRRLVGTRLRHAVIAVGVAETSVALFVLAEPWNSSAAIAILAGFALCVTGYGLVSLRETGTCGCSGMTKVSTARALMARNMGLFGLGILGLQFGPPVSELNHQPQWVVAAQPALIWGLLVAVVIVRAVPNPGAALAQTRFLSRRIQQ